jgi:hypothetical protein
MKLCVTLSHIMHIVFICVYIFVYLYVYMSKQLSSMRTPVKIEILASAENIPLLNNDLHEILIDASNCCEFSSYVDKDGETRVKIECMVNEDEKEHFWDLLRFKHKRDCSISSEPCELQSYSFRFIRLYNRIMATVSYVGQKMLS